MTCLVTGGCGFIGSNFIRHLLGRDPSQVVVNLDKLTYAGNTENLADLAGEPRYRFVRGDICDATTVRNVFGEFDPSRVVNFAAESHVDRSIGRPDDFIRTDVYGVFVLLEEARKHGVERFIQISTDEVYGSIRQGSFRETDPMMPSSPYSASKAGGERLAYSYWTTYKLPVIITRASNTFGAYQYPEKLIPLFVTNALENQPLPVYGDGSNVRDWLYVEDHCAAVHFLMEYGEPGEAYNIGGGNEMPNLRVTHRILERLGKGRELIRFVEDRKGHDFRYSIDGSKLRTLGWSPAADFSRALDETIDWYRDRSDWWGPIKSGEFLEYYRNHYKTELAA